MIKNKMDKNVMEKEINSQKKGMKNMKKDKGFQMTMQERLINGGTKEDSQLRLNLVKENSKKLEKVFGLNADYVRNLNLTEEILDFKFKDLYESLDLRNYLLDAILEDNFIADEARKMYKSASRIPGTKHLSKKVMINCCKHAASLNVVTVLTIMKAKLTPEFSLDLLYGLQEYTNITPKGRKKVQFLTDVFFKEELEHIKLLMMLLTHKSEECIEYLEKQGFSK